MSNLKRLGRRRFLARAGGSLGALLLSGCDGLSANPGFTKILESVETVSRSVQSALTGRTALAREYTESDLSAEFRANGTTEPTDPDYQKLAQNGLKIGASLWTASFRSLQVSRWPNSTRRSTTPGVAPVCIMDELQFQTADPPRLARQTPDDRDSRGHPGPRVRWGIGVLLGAGVLINISTGSTCPLAHHSCSRNSVSRMVSSAGSLAASFGPTRCCRSRPA